MLLPLLFAVCGLALGSFGSVLVERLPRGASLGGRSRCPACGRTLAPADLVPLLSYLVLRGRCRSCGARIALLYPLLELTSMGLALVSLALEQTAGAAVLLAVALWLLLLIAVVDARTQTIPDALSMSLVLVAFLYQRAGGEIVLGGAILLAGVLGGQWAVSFGRWVGSGDVLLSLGAGLLVGTWERAFLALAVAYILGMCAAAALLVTGRATRESSIAFGPFLVGGTLATVLFGDAFLRSVTWFMP